MINDKEDVGMLKARFELTIHSKEARKLILGRVIDDDNNEKIYDQWLRVICHAIK